MNQKGNAVQIRADAGAAAEYRAAGWWGDETMGSTVRRWGAERPDAVAFVSGPTRFTWSQYDATADAIARALLAGAPAEGERVAVLLPDGPGVHAAFVGIERAGLVVVGVGHRAGDREIAHLLTLTGATVLVTVAEQRGRSAAQLRADLAALGATVDRLVLVDVDGVVLDAGVPETSRSRTPPTGRSRRPTPTRSSSSTPRRARPGCPSAWCTPRTGGSTSTSSPPTPARSGTTRSSSAPSPRRSASASGPRTSPRRSSAARRWSWSASTPTRPST